MPVIRAVFSCGREGNEAADLEAVPGAVSEESVCGMARSNLMTQRNMPKKQDREPELSIAIYNFADTRLFAPEFQWSFHRGLIFLLSFSMGRTGKKDKSIY
jgi:hypothetical protein